MADQDYQVHRFQDKSALLREGQMHAATIAAWVRRQVNLHVSLPVALLPSFIQNRLNPKPPSKGHGGNITALDGLRGLSCLAVINMHWAFAVTDSNDGGSGETNAAYLFHRPFWYLLWAGTSHVNVFFVMSGYVLSIKCLKNIHQGIAVNTVITSAVFRRATRIFLPPIVLLFIYLFAIRLGVFDKASTFFQDQNIWRAYPIRLFEAPPQILPSFAAQFWDVLGAIGGLIDPNAQFSFPNYGSYDTHLWTMPTEYYCSIALYIVLVATCRLYTSYRLLCHTLLVLYCWLASHQHYALFFSGMTIAEADTLFKRRLLPAHSPLLLSHPSPYAPATARPTLQHLRSYFSPLNLLLTLSAFSGLYLLSMPLLWAEDTPPFDTLLTFMPHYMSIAQQGEALRALGAVLLVWPITLTATIHASSNDMPIISALLTNPVSLYLGSISFSIYLLHGFVIRSLGYSILPAIFRAVVRDPARREAMAPQPIADALGNVAYFVNSSEKLTAWEVGCIYMLGYAVVLPVSVWAADLFWRGCDVRCVWLGRWIEERMTKGEGGPVTPVVARFREKD